MVSKSPRRDRLEREHSREATLPLAYEHAGRRPSLLLGTAEEPLDCALSTLPKGHSILSGTSRHTVMVPEGRSPQEFNRTSTFLDTEFTGSR